MLIQNFNAETVSKLVSAKFLITTRVGQTPGVQGIPEFGTAYPDTSVKRGAFGNESSLFFKMPLQAAPLRNC